MSDANSPEQRRDRHRPRYGGGGHSAGGRGPGSSFLVVRGLWRLIGWLVGYVLAPGSAAFAPVWTVVAASVIVLSSAAPAVISHPVIDYRDFAGFARLGFGIRMSSTPRSKLAWMASGPATSASRADRRRRDCATPARRSTPCGDRLRAFPPPTSSPPTKQDANAPATK